MVEKVIMVKCPFCGSEEVRKHGHSSSGKQVYDCKNPDELLELLKPFKIDKVYFDNNFAYKNHITKSKVVAGKRNTQKIERKHLSFRTWCSRLVRKGIRFSKLHQMHRIAVGLVINSWCFGRNLPIEIV